MHLLVHLNLFIYLKDKETRILLLAYVLFSIYQLLGNCLHAPRRMYFGLSSFPLLSKQDSSRSNLGVEQTLGSLGLSSKESGWLCPCHLCSPPLISRASLVAQRLKHLPGLQETRFDPWVRKIPWRRKWQPTPVLLPGESHGVRSLVDYNPWGHKELDTTERIWPLSLYISGNGGSKVLPLILRDRETFWVTVNVFRGCSALLFLVGCGYPCHSPGTCFLRCVVGRALSGHLSPKERTFSCFKKPMVQALRTSADPAIITLSSFLIS